MAILLHCFLITSSKVNKKPPDEQLFGSPASEDFQLENYPFFLIDRINSSYGLAIENVLRKHNMERIQWQLLLIMREQDPVSISELARISGRKLSTVSRTIERMRNESLVSTATRKSDQRVTEVNLEAEGRQRLTMLIEVANRQYLHAMKGIGNREIGRLQEQLQIIFENLSRSPFE